MSRSEERFDLNVLKNEWVKYRYQNFIQRSIETLDSLSKGYRKDNANLKVDVFYYRSPSLNAFVEKKGEEYLLGISIATLPLLVTFFDKLLGFSYVLPELTAASTSPI